MWFFSGVTQSVHFAPKLPALDPNAGFTSEALGRLVASDWLHGIVPWWNPYSGIGMPLAGELQPGAFFFPFNMLLLLPEGLLWQRLLMQVIAGLGTYALLRELGISRLAALMGGTLYALNGTIAWTPGPTAVYCATAFSPLLLWGIERARRPGQGAVSILVVGSAVAWSLLAGFPEPAYISGLLAMTWGLYRLVSTPHRFAYLVRLTGGLILGLLVAAPILISFLDYLQQSDALAAHRWSGISLPPLGFSATVLPYVYGPLTFDLHSKLLGFFWANVGGFTTVLVVVMAVAALSQRSANRGLQILLAVWVVLAWGRTFGVQPITFLIDHLPLLSQTATPRYAPPSWELALAILAAFGLETFHTSSPRRRYAFGVAVFLLIACTVLAWPQRSVWAWSRSQILVMLGCLLLSLTWALAGLIAVWLAWKRMTGERRRLVLAGLLIFDAAGMFLLPQLSARRHGRIDTAAIQFLRNHQGLSRVYTMGPLEPNYGAYFQIASINHNAVPIPKLWAHYVDDHLLPGSLQHSNGMTFWPDRTQYEDGGEGAFRQNLAHYLNIGVRYLITYPGQNPFATTYPRGSNLNGNEASNGRSEGAIKIRLLRWCREVLENKRKPELERLFANRLAQAIVDGKSIREKSEENRGSGVEHESELVLGAGQSADLDLILLPTTPREPSIAVVGIRVRNVEATADASLVTKLCAGSTCQLGERPLSTAIDDSMFRVRLNKPLVASEGTQLHLTVTNQAGTGAVALALVADDSDQQQHLRAPGKAPLNSALLVELQYGPAAADIHQIYSDPVMDIWELPSAAPYFQVIQGGPCTLSSNDREELAADCIHPANLLRRELYMPGWLATRTGAEPQPVQQNGIFQTSTVPAGRSQIRYSFTPLHMTIGWMAGLAGMAGLLLQMLWMAFESTTAKSG